MYKVETIGRSVNQSLTIKCNSSLIGSADNPSTYSFRIMLPLSAVGPSLSTYHASIVSSSFFSNSMLKARQAVHSRAAMVFDKAGII